MKIIVTLFWSLVIGQIAGYIMTALTTVPDNPLAVLIVSFIFGFFVLLFEYAALEKPKATEK